MMHYLVLLLLLGVVFQWMSIPANTTPLGTLPWQGQTLAMHGDVGEYSALALDSNGRPHIIYYERAIDTQLGYGYWDGVIWRFEAIPFTMPEQNSYQPGLALAVDEVGIVHIAYYHNQQQALYYGRRDASGWSGGVVDNVGNVGRYLSLKVAQNMPQISYYDTTNQDLKYALWNGIAWQIEVVDSSGNVGEYNSLALDSARRPHISYYDATNQRLKYARLNVTWQLETVPTGGSAGRGTSLALDSLEQPHIAYVYSDPSGFQLHYARKNGPAWSSEVVSTLNVGSVSLALGPGGVAHIAYDALGRYLYHADNQTGTWEITAVDTTSEHAINPSLSVDAAGRPHLSYYLTDFSDLRYSTQAEQWRIETVDLSINNNSFISMAYDSAGSPRFSYNNGGFLALTGWNGTNWIAENVLQTADPRYSSLAYDVQGRPHIAFYNHTNGDLFYAVQNGTTWSVFPVDSSGDVGQYARLMLTPEGAPVIAYWDNTNYRVKVAAQVNGGWIRGTHTAAPPLNADSGHLSAGLAYDGAVYISYYDAPNTDLRVATARLNGASWTWQDELIGISEGHTGPANDLAMTADMYFPTLAYVYSDTAGNRALRYATRPPGSAWSSTQFRPLGGNNVIGLGLNLRAGNANTPRVAYLLNEPSQKTLWLASNNGFTWTFEQLAAVAVANVTHWPRPVVLANGVDRVAYVDGASLRLASRATTQERPFVSADRTAYMPNAEAFGLCLCFLLQCLDWETPETAEHLSLASSPGLTQPEVFHQMGALFGATEGGRYYMDLYKEHGLEIYAVMTQRPSLLWNSYRTLHELMPGLEALVTGRGDEVVVTSSMIAHAYDVWLSLSLFGSPALRSAIQTELARTNNLQDFYGMTFNEWALAIGVEPPEQKKVYLPIVLR